MGKEQVSISISSIFLLLFAIFPFQTPVQTRVEAQVQKKNSSVSAIFIFGDSTVDPGNNNFVSTIFRSNFPPYGKDYPQQIPTGRFTDGKLVTDFIASYIGLKDVIPPYLDATLGVEELLTGVSFASAGSGYDPLTPALSRVVSLPDQLDYFKEYLKKMEMVMGKKGRDDLIRESLYLISCGTNDFIVNYYALPIERRIYNLEDYQNFLLHKLGEVIQELTGAGAKKIAVVGLPPFGCLPEVITSNSKQSFGERGCIEDFNLVARAYNQKLQVYVNSIQMNFEEGGGRIAYGDIYLPLAEMIQNPLNYGFEEWRRGCCGTGLIEAGILCNSKSVLCGDTSKYLFWDAIHPTERAYYFIFLALRSTIDGLLN